MLTRHQDTLVLKNGRLRALRSSSNMRLQKLIAASVTSQAVERPMQESSPIFIEKPLGMPLIAEAVSIRDLVTLVSHTAHTILLLSDMDKRPRSKFSALSSVFGLTPAEMRLCEVMLAGCSLSEAADRLEITSNTARQRLKTVFHKTSTHRQGELLLLLSSF